MTAGAVIYVQLLVVILTAVVATSSYFVVVRGLKPSNEAFRFETTM